MQTNLVGSYVESVHDGFNIKGIVRAVTEPPDSRDPWLQPLVAVAIVAGCAMIATAIYQLDCTIRRRS